MMGQCRFANYNKCTTALGDVDIGEAMLNFAVNLIFFNKQIKSFFFFFLLELSYCGSVAECKLSNQVRIRPLVRAHAWVSSSIPNRGRAEGS